MLYRSFQNGGGGSNLNTQLLKNMTGAKRDAQRKFVETLSAYQISINHEPEEILTHYLNTVSFAGGRGHSGVAMASLEIFGRPIQALNELEMLYLTTTLTRSNSLMLGGEVILYSEAKAHGDLIKIGLLRKAKIWLDDEVISKKEFNILRRQTLDFKVSSQKHRLPIASRDFYNKCHKKEARGFQSVISTVSIDNQFKISNAASSFDRKFKKFQNVDGFMLMKAALVIDVKSGEVLGHYGGEGVADLVTFSNGNQVGSVIKPFLLLELLETGMSPEEIKLYDGRRKGEATPKNYSRKYSNKMVSIETTLSKSLNAAMVNVRHLHEPIPLFNKTEESFTAMRISEDKSIDLNSRKRAKEYELNYPLGSRRMTLFDIAQAYQTLMNDGKYVSLHIAKSAFNGTTLQVAETKALPEKVYSKFNANFIKSALAGTLKKGGTGTHFASMLPNEKMFYAKTGTSEGAIHGYTILSDGDILIVSYVTYGRVENDRLELNNTPSIPYESGGKTAGIFAAMIYNKYTSAANDGLIAFMK